MSSDDDEDYASSSSGDDDDDGDDGSDFEVEEQPPSSKPNVKRGGIASSSATNTTNGGSPSRRNARRYTTADIDRHIATYNEEGDDGSENKDVGSSSSEYDDADAAAEEDEDSDDDYDEKKPAPSKSKQGNAKKRGAIKFPGRRRGMKQAATKKPVAKDSSSDSDYGVRRRKKPVTKKKKPVKKKPAAKNKYETESDEVSTEESPDEGDGGEEGDSSSSSDFGAPRPKKRVAKKKQAANTSSRGNKATAKKPPANKRATRPTRSSTYQESSSSEEEEEAAVQYDITPSGSRRPRRQCKPQTQQRMHDMVQRDMQSEKEALADVLEDDDKELMENSDRGGSKSSSDEDEVLRGHQEQQQQQQPRGGDDKGGNKAEIPKKKRGTKYSDDESYEGAQSDTNNSSDDDDMSDYEESDDGVSNRRQSARNNNARKSQRHKQSTKKRASYKDVDDSDFGTADEDSDDAADGPSILMSPAGKGSQGIGCYGSPNARQRARTGRTPLDVHDEGESSDESYEDVDTKKGKKRKNSSKKTESKSSKKESKKKKLKPKKKRRRLSVGSDDDESDSSEYNDAGESSDDGEASGEDHSGDPKHALLKSPYCTKSPMTLKTTNICCPSKIDDITMVNLPKNKPHVCYIAPDGKTRHCFALDTLYRIAISSSNTNANNNIIDALTNGGGGGGAQQLNFLQPPHFRSPMEDDLLDQIASRFGRSALIIENSAVYKKIVGGSYAAAAAALDEELDEFDEDGEYIGYSETGTPVHRNFRDRFERYMQNLMGSTDVYCCPLCYNEADRRLGNNGDEEMWEDDETSEDGGGDESEDRMSFLDDPLTILGSLDSEKFEVASSFCFRLLSGLKTHLKVVHGVKVSDVVGNDLFKRFQIRASDGLLQSWLRKSLRQNTVQGDMMRYWLNGENQSFVLLLNQIDKNGLRGEQSGEYQSDFSASFPNRAKRIWRDVSSPYLKDMKDMEDFIAEEGDDEEEGDGDAVAASVPVNPNFTPPRGKRAFKSPEQLLIEHLQKKNKKHPTFDDSSNDSSSSGAGENGGDGSSDDELEVLPEPPRYEEVEEEDEWTKSKMLKAKKGRQTNLKPKNGNGGDSSEDDDVFDSDTEQLVQINGGARKRAIGSSDEESDKMQD